MFPHEINLVIVDQLLYKRKGHMETSESNIPMIGQSFPTNESLGVGMYMYLMVTFHIPTPINYLGMTSVGEEHMYSCR